MISTQERMRETVRAVRAWTGETVAGLAGSVGMSQPNLSEKLGGKLRFSMDDVDAIAAHWGLTFADLLHGFEGLQENGRLPYAARAARQISQEIRP